MRYSDLVDVLTTRLGVKVDDVALLRSVQAVAVLVQGCWAVKSEFLYVTTHASNSNGITGPEMQRGRDIIVILLPIDIETIKLYSLLSFS